MASCQGQGFIPCLSHAFSLTNPCYAPSSIFLCPLSCRLGHRWTSTLHRFHIAVATNNYSILSRSGVHILSMPHAFPFTNPHHAPSSSILLCPVSYRLGHRRTSTFHRFHIAVATNNYGILSRSGVHPLSMPHTFPLTTPPLLLH